MLGDIMDKAVGMQEQSLVSNEMVTLRKNQKKSQSFFLKKITKMKNAFDGLVSGLDMDEERSSEVKHISIESLKTKKQKEQRL